MDLLGITEIVGKKGSAKTRYVTALIGSKNTLYFTTKPTRNIPANSFIVTLHDLQTLLDFTTTIETFVQLQAIECIVIDTLDSLCTTQQFNLFYKDVFKIVTLMRALSFRYSMAVYILNEFDNGSNYIMKRWWTYLVNRKVEIAKQGDVFTVSKRRMYKKGVEVTRFRVENNAIVFIT